MKLFKIIFLIIITVFILTNCSDVEYDENKPEDFALIYTNDFDTYDSKTCIFTRSYLSSDSIIEFCLTEEELLNIYSEFKDYEFMSFPEEFICKEPNFGAFSYTFPANTTTLEITYKGIKKKVSNSNYCSRKKEQRKSKRFDKLSAHIFKIIKNNSSVKEMRETDIMKL